MFRRLFRNWLRQLAWQVIKATNEPGIPHVAFTHHVCGSGCVIPLGRYFPAWEEPAFVCIDCDCITTDVGCHLVEIEKDPCPDDGSMPAYALY